MPFSPLSRRECLQLLFGSAAAFSASAAWSDGEGTDLLLGYLESLAREDGGYGWPDWEQSHVTPTHAVVGCYRLLKREMPRSARAAAFLRENHPYRIKRLERDQQALDFEQVQALAWLGQGVEAFRETAAAWTEPPVYPRQYERNGYPVFQHQVKALLCRDLVGLPRDGAASFVTYVESRRRANGSFNNTPAADGSDGHVMNTLWGLLALRVLGKPLDPHEVTVRWLQRCQLPSGGFTHQPNATIGAVDDAGYTRAAVLALRVLGAAPEDREGCLRYLRRLRNADGGCGHRPAWTSNPVATYYVLDALSALGAVEQATDGRPAAVARQPEPLPAGLKVWSAQIQASGGGSVSEAVDLARDLKIDLWGAKNAKPGWIERAQQLAGERKVPVTFFVANEEYGTFVSMPGQGIYSHTSDLMAPAGKEFGASLAGEPLPWPEFRERRVRDLDRAGGMLYWQFGENEEITRLFLDDSLERGGFGAISTFHFGNPDFTNSSPYLYRYYGQLPFVALQDAHGTEPWWWSERLGGFRTLFLGTEPTWTAWRTALRNNWVASVRHDAVSGFRTWRRGLPHVLEVLRRQEREWRWWDDRPDSLRRPLAALTVLRPGDEGEPGRPGQGVALRVRTWWETSPQAILKRQLVEVAALEVDGRKVEPQRVEKKNAQGRLVDVHLLYTWPDAPAGRHRAAARLRRLDGGAEAVLEREFEV